MKRQNRPPHPPTTIVSTPPDHHRIETESPVDLGGNTPKTLEIEHDDDVLMCCSHGCAHALTQNVSHVKHTFHLRAAGARSAPLARPRDDGAFPPRNKDHPDDCQTRRHVYIRKTAERRWRHNNDDGGGGGGDMFRVFSLITN